MIPLFYSVYLELTVEDVDVYTRWVGVFGFAGVVPRMLFPSLFYPYGGFPMAEVGLEDTRNVGFEIYHLVVVVPENELGYLRN